MVKSKLNNDINYHEYSHLEEEDFNYNTPLFNLKILGITVIIGVGQLNYHFSKRYSVVYVPIYLFNAETEFMKQIGVYEMPSNNVKMDDSGDLDIHKLKPLLYGFVNTELLRKSLVKAAAALAASAATTKKMKAETAEIKKSLGKKDDDRDRDNDDTDDDDNDDDEHKDDIDIDDIAGLNPRQKHLLSGASVLPLQTKEQSELERKQYKHNSTDLWIQMYLRNKYFNFIDNEGGSDSLFAVIRDALLTQGRTATILELRKQLSDEVTDEVFRIYRENFALYHGVARTQTREMKELVNQYNDLKRRISTIHDRAQQQLMIGGAKKLVIEHNMKLDEVKYTKLLAAQYDYMKEVRSTQQLKERMMTSLYWPDAWAVATMERILNMKFVFFSSNAYETGDIDNVLQCGGADSIDAVILKRGVFEPTAYVLIDKGIVMTMAGAGRGTGVRTMAMESAGGDNRSRSPRTQRSPRAPRSPRSSSATATGGFISKTTNQHKYKLITYKTHGILSFSELPYDVKLLITTKCLETQSGAFCMIPQFKLFQKELGIRADDLQNTSLDDLLEEIHMADSAGTGNRAGSHLYSPDIVFQFYAKSNPNALPGVGPGEKIPEHDKIHFQKLATFDNWRRKLSNFWCEPFLLDNHTWQSVEHYYQGSKFKNNNREFYLKFSLDSRSELSADPVLAKAAGSKSGKLKNALVGATSASAAAGHDKSILRPSKITIDPDFFNHGRSEREMENAIYAKFSQNKGLCDMLLATRNAKLVQYVRGGHPIVFHHLMRVRHKLRTNMTSMR
jgi:predicted NAD-dependent protein-ADP-ribosyltransferase YbiA (DUF1768 family)